MTPRGVAGVRTPRTAWVPAPDPGHPAFRLGRTPVTNGEYAPYLAEGGVAEPPWWNDPAFSAPEQPVVGVTWSEAAGFAAWLGPVVGGFWRLPTAAEWEWAARGGLPGAATAWGESLPEGEIPAGPLLGPWPAGRGTPNGYGLMDMGTIVHEWCADVLRDPRAPEGERRVSCGGSWRHQVRWSPPAARSSLPPSYRYADYGFRVLREGTP
jgi:formylglycine-generating enzyme required for sulfatase activity